MHRFFIVTKLIILKILLASIAGLSDAAYDFGYHPSAEEFDNLMRETSKTWTRDLLANERRHSWTTSDLSTGGNFVPKYNHESAARIHYDNTPPYSTWPPGYVKKVKKPQQNDRRHDQQSAANVFIGGDIGSNLDFQMFSSDESAGLAPQIYTDDPIKFATLDQHNIFSNAASAVNENQHQLHQKPLAHFPSENNNIFSGNVLKPQSVAVAADEYDQHQKPVTGGENIFSNNFHTKPSQFTGDGGSDSIFLNSGHHKRPLLYAAGGSDDIYLNNVHKKPSQFAANSDNNFSNTFNKKPQPRPPHFAAAAAPGSDDMFFNNNIVKPNDGDTTITSDIIYVNNSPVPIKQTLSSSVIEIASTPSETYHNNQPVSNSRPLNLNKNNNTEAQFPIFFTNPTTGIVYAITEVGKIPHNSATSVTQQTNDSIPIYITKEQYDRDLFLVRKHYENACHPLRNKDKNGEYPVSGPSSVLSVSSNTTVRPQIIRLQNPAYGIKKFPIPKLPTHLNKHPTEGTISSHINLPPKRKKKTKKKKKKSNKRRPGHKLPATTAKTTVDLQIVKGVRGTTDVKPSTSTSSKYTSQLERPSLRPTTATIIYSSRPLAATSGYMSPISKVGTSDQDNENLFNPYPNHRLMKRSVASQIEQLQNKRIPLVETENKNFLKIMNTNRTKTIRGTHKLPGKRKRISKLGNRTSHITSSLRKGVRNETTTIRHDVHVTNHNFNATVMPQHNHTFLKVTSTTAKSFNNSRRDGVNFPIEGHKKTRKKNSKSSKREKGDSGFDLFDLVDDDDDSDSNDDDEYNDSYYDYEEVVQDHTKRPIKFKIKHQVQIAQPDDYTEDSTSIDDLKENLQPDNDSSAAGDVDFGAMEEEKEKETATPFYVTITTEKNPSSNTKRNTVSKKRIRRRPPIDTSISYEDYDDDDNDAASGGIGSFFRMVFYPVQVLMTRIFDGFDEQQQNTKPKYPTYTHYSNAAGVNIESEEDDETTNSLASWFSSWFGFNRRTKKIGSTTAAPPPQSPPPTVATNWFESWFGGGKTTTEASYEDYYSDDDDKWFFGWFDAKPKRKRRTTTTSTTTTIPQIPILTIVDPLKNPQNWIGILAHHIINSTSTTTHNPLIDAITRATTTENPDIPRKIAYDKYQIWRLKPQDDSQVKALNEYKRSEDGARLQWLKGPSLRGLTDVLVPPKMLVDFQGTLNFETIDHEVLIFDVGKAIAYEKTKEKYFFNTTPHPHHSSSNQKHQVKAAPLNMSWHKYHAYDEIVSYLELIRQRHPQIIELIHIGRSYEGRPLVIVKVESKEAAAATSATVQANRKKFKTKRKSVDANAVFIEAGTHGLEWIGPATSLWMVSELLRIMKSNKTNTDHELIRNTTWYIMPILNPDGYVYSHEYDRFWKKTRSRHISRPSSIITSAMTWLQQKKITEKVCFGVDLDRNWHYQWGKRGSSKSPCNELYAGPQAFSEPETKALSEFLMDYRQQIKLYISMQAYGQILSYPIKANASYNSERIDDFHDVAMVGMDGLRKKGSKSRYKIDATSDLMENRSGCSDAFAAYEVGIPFSYTMHLADNGVHGYLLPSSSIEPTAKDAFEMITAMIDYI